MYIPLVRFTEGMAINQETIQYLLNNRRGFYKSGITAVFLLNNGLKVDHRDIRCGYYYNY